MPNLNITQLRRVIFRKKTTAGGSWSVFTLEADDLGQDSVMSVNVAPRTRSRASSLGTATTPIEGSFNDLSGSVTFMLDNWKILGQAIQKWNAATYAGAQTGAGQVILGDGNLCGDGQYFSVVAQGLCDDGSAADVELTRCFPSVDDAIEIGTGDTQTVTLNLHPIVFNSAQHSGDGYPAYTVRFGENDITKKTRLNASTGAYDDVSES